MGVVGHAERRVQYFEEVGVPQSRAVLLSQLLPPPDSCQLPQLISSTNSDIAANKEPTKYKSSFASEPLEPQILPDINPPEPRRTIAPKSHRPAQQPWRNRIDNPQIILRQMIQNRQLFDCIQRQTFSQLLWCLILNR